MKLNLCIKRLKISKLLLFNIFHLQMCVLKNRGSIIFLGGDIYTLVTALFGYTPTVFNVKWNTKHTWISIYLYSSNCRLRTASYGLWRLIWWQLTGLCGWQIQSQELGEVGEAQTSSVAGPTEAVPGSGDINQAKAEKVFKHEGCSLE